MSNAFKPFIVIVLLGAVFIAAHVGSLTAQTPAQPTEGKAITKSLDGRFRVEYSAAGTQERLDDIRRIEFHDEYFVIFGFQQQGRVIPLAGLTQLKWDPI